MDEASATRVGNDPALRSMAQRRRRVWLSVGLFLLVTCLMVVLSMAQRDHDEVRACRARMEFARGHLQRIFDHSGLWPPAELPLPRPDTSTDDERALSDPVSDEEYFTLRTHYLYNARHSQPANGHLVGVCCCEQPHDLYVRQDGRHVILFDGASYELRWMTESEFRRRARELGLNVSERR